MTIYKPKPGDKKVEKKSDASNSKIRISEDVVWTRMIVVLCRSLCWRIPHNGWQRRKNTRFLKLTIVILIFHVETKS